TRVSAVEAPAPAEHVAPAAPAATPPPREPARRAKLSLHIYPWADVYVDGALQERGVMDVELELSPQRHELRAVHPAFPEWRETVNPKPGEASRRQIRMGQP